MPTMVGSALWSLCNALLLYFAIKKLEFEKWKTAIIIWLSYNGLYLSVVTQQYNAAVAAFILFYFYSCREKKRFLGCIDDCVRHINQNLWDCGVSFFLFSKRKLYFLVGNSILGIRSICSSNVLYFSQYVFDSYKEWVSILEVKNDVNELSFYHEYLFIRNGSKDYSCC